MTLNIIDHGVWVPYKPTSVPPGFPANTMFAHREGDRFDWYEYIRPDQNLTPPVIPGMPPAPPLPSHFQAGSIKATVYRHRDLNVDLVGAAVADVTMLFPITNRIIEITGYTGTDPQTDFGGKVYNHTAGTFTALVMPAPQPTAFEREVRQALRDIIRRLDRLEHPHSPHV